MRSAAARAGSGSDPAALPRGAPFPFARGREGAGRRWGGPGGLCPPGRRRPSLGFEHRKEASQRGSAATEPREHDSHLQPIGDRPFRAKPCASAGRQEQDLAGASELHLQPGDSCRVAVEHPDLYDAAKAQGAGRRSAVRERSPLTIPEPPEARASNLARAAGQRACHRAPGPPINPPCSHSSPIPPD